MTNGISIKLSKHATIGGKSYQAGATVKVAPTTAKWLETQGVVEENKPPLKPKPKAEFNDKA